MGIIGAEMAENFLKVNNRAGALAIHFKRYRVDGFRHDRKFLNSLGVLLFQKGYQVKIFLCRPFRPGHLSLYQNVYTR